MNYRYTNSDYNYNDLYYNEDINNSLVEDKKCNCACKNTKTKEMTIEELLRLHSETCIDARSIMRAKNKDYSSNIDDPFSNLNASEIFGVPGELGLLIRVVDKLKRMHSFIVNGSLAVKDEPVEDAIKDVINYMVLLKGMIKVKKENKK